MKLFKRKEYVYLVSYTFQGGTGTIVINMTRKIKNVKSLNIIKQYIEETSKKDNVAIMNYIFVGKEWN